MSIEHKNTPGAAHLDPASPVSDANADELSHHPIADLFPVLAEKELVALAEDIAAHGQREPGVGWKKCCWTARTASSPAHEIIHLRW